jgi:hypothetical protein
MVAKMTQMRTDSFGDSVVVAAVASPAPASADNIRTQSGKVVRAVPPDHSIGRTLTAPRVRVNSPSPERKPSLQLRATAHFPE